MNETPRAERIISWLVSCNRRSSLAIVFIVCRRLQPKCAVNYVKETLLCALFQLLASDGPKVSQEKHLRQ